MSKLISVHGVLNRRHLLGLVALGTVSGALSGCASVGVSYGAHEPASFADHGTLHVAHSVQDLHDWLLRNA